MLKYIDFCHFQKKYQKQLLNKELDASKKAIHKFGELLGNRNAVTQTKPNDIKMEHCERSKFLNDSTVTKFVAKQWVKVNDLSSGQCSTNKI